MKNCVCYVIDDNYLFPTLVSAMQARSHIALDVADVIVICICETRTKLQLVEEIAAKFGVQILHARSAQIENLHPMYGRLFISDILPPHYDRVVYIDGDTQIAGSLAPLFDVTVKPGMFLAVRDPSNMFARLSKKWMQRIVHERSTAGLDEDYDRYFNTGVLVFNCGDWSELAGLTLATIRSRGNAFRYGDQDPMNLAIGDRCEFIPNKWNFPGFLIGSRLERTAEPVIYHFMSNPRPWTHAGMPWGSKWQRPYVELLAKFPHLSVLAPKLTLKSKLKYHFQQILKTFTEYKLIGMSAETRADLII